MLIIVEAFYYFYSNRENRTESQDSIENQEIKANNDNGQSSEWEEWDLSTNSADIKTNNDNCQSSEWEEWDLSTDSADIKTNNGNSQSGEWEDWDGYQWSFPFPTNSADDFIPFKKGEYDKEGGDECKRNASYKPPPIDTSDNIYETVPKGQNFGMLRKLVARLQGVDPPDPISSFSECITNSLILEVIEKCGYDVPTLIQSYSLPITLKKRDLVACAQVSIELFTFA